MTPRDAVQRFDAWINGRLKLVLTVFAVGVAWATLTAALGQKADKSEVAEMVRDVKAIKSLVCKDHPGDSLCR